MKGVLEALKETGKHVVPIAIGDVGSDLVKKGLEAIPNSPIKGGLAKVVGALALAVASAFVKDTRAKSILQLGAAAGLWQGIKEIAKEKGLYKLGEPEVVAVEVAPEVEVYPEEERKRKEEEIEVYEAPQEIEVV